jgi:hypothetical protein
MHLGYRNQVELRMFMVSFDCQMFLCLSRALLATSVQRLAVLRGLGEQRIATIVNQEN